MVSQSKPLALLFRTSRAKFEFWTLLQPELQFLLQILQPKLRFPLLQQLPFLHQCWYRAVCITFLYQMGYYISAVPFFGSGSPDWLNRSHLRRHCYRIQQSPQPHLIRVRGRVSRVWAQMTHQGSRTCSSLGLCLDCRRRGLVPLAAQGPSLRRFSWEICRAGKWLVQGFLVDCLAARSSQQETLGHSIGVWFHNDSGLEPRSLVHHKFTGYHLSPLIHPAIHIVLIQGYPALPQTMLFSPRAEL